jgi:hypothetical protein
MTAAEAANDWINFVELEKRDCSMLALCRQVVDQQIAPRLGNEKLANLTPPRVDAVRDGLLWTCTRRLTKRVLAKLKSILRDAQRPGHVAQNVSDLTISADKRGEGRLEVGIDIPTGRRYPKSWQPQRQAASARFSSLRYSPAYDRGGDTDSGGRTSTSPREGCMFASVPRYNPVGGAPTAIEHARFLAVPSSRTRDAKGSPGRDAGRKDAKVTRSRRGVRSFPRVKDASQQIIIIAVADRGRRHYSRGGRQW